jgi:hypothetical protein
MTEGELAVVVRDLALEILKVAIIRVSVADETFVVIGGMNVVHEPHAAGHACKVASFEHISSNLSDSAKY